MKHLITPLAILAVAVSANAGIAGANFEAKVNFTPSCVAATPVLAPALNFGSYTAFGTTLNPLDITVSFNCSRGTGPTFGSIVGGTYAVFPVNNLYYSLGFAGPSSASGGAASPSLNGIGEPDSYGYTVTGTLPKQAGKFTTMAPVSETVVRTVLIGF